MRIDLIQIASPDDESISDRRERVSRMVLSSKADFVVLPELWAVGYNNFSSYSTQAERLDGRTITDAANWAQQLNAYVHAGSFVEDAGNGRFHNTTALLAPSGELIHVYRKVHVFGYKSEEAALLAPGDGISTVPSPLGVVGATTCYDLRFPEIWRSLIDEGAEAVVTPAAWPVARLAHWQLFTATRAVENQILVIACNAVGEQRGVALGGHSRVVDPWGNVLLEAGLEEGVYTVEVDPTHVSDVRQEFPVLKDRRVPVTVTPEGTS